MRFSRGTAVLVAGVALADPLATVNPCPQATSSTYQPITITSQYQTYSTCYPTTACVHAICNTNYPFETSSFVSSTIPNAWNGETGSSTLVTAIDQDITISQFSATQTRYVTPSPTTIGRTIYVHKPTPIYLTIRKDFHVPYNNLGPLAIPGYSGSDLCESCGIQSDGSRQQIVDVTECRAGPFGARCLAYEETWISQSAPAVTSSVVAPFSTHWVAPSAGTFTLTITIIEPARVITDTAQTFTVPPQPWYTEITHTCYEPLETIDLTTTIMETIYFTVPYSRQAPRTASWVPQPTGAYWGEGVEPKDGGFWSGEDPFGGGDWSNPGSSQTNAWQDWFSALTSTPAGSSSGPTYTSHIWTTTDISSSSAGNNAPVSGSSSGSSSSSSSGVFPSSASLPSTSAAPVSTTVSTTSSLTSTLVTSTTKTSVIAPSIGPFNLFANTAGDGLRRRQSDYFVVAFEGKDGFLTNDEDSAAPFFIDGDGYLVSGGQYVDADYSFSSIRFSIIEQPPTNLAKFDISSSNELYIVEDVENHGFCYKSGSQSVEILFGAQSTQIPCNPVKLYTIEPLSSTTTGTTTVAITSSNTSLSPQPPATTSSTISFTLSTRTPERSPPSSFNSPSSVSVSSPSSSKPSSLPSSASSGLFSSFSSFKSFTPSSLTSSASIGPPSTSGLSSLAPSAVLISSSSSGLTSSELTSTFSPFSTASTSRLAASALISTSSSSSTFSSAFTSTSSSFDTSSTSSSATASFTLAAPASGFRIRANAMGLSKRDESRYLNFEISTGHMGPSTIASMFSINDQHHLVELDGLFIGAAASENNIALLEAFGDLPSLSEWQSNSAGELRLAGRQFCLGDDSTIVAQLPNVARAISIGFQVAPSATTSNASISSGSSATFMTSSTATSRNVATIPMTSSTTLSSPGTTSTAFSTIHGSNGTTTSDLTVSTLSSKNAIHQNSTTTPNSGTTTRLSSSFVSGPITSNVTTTTTLASILATTNTLPVNTTLPATTTVSTTTLATTIPINTTLSTTALATTLPITTTSSTTTTTTTLPPTTTTLPSSTGPCSNGEIGVHIYTASENTFIVYCGFGMNSDISRKDPNATNLEACIASCASDSDCFAVDWYPSGCLLLADHGGFFPWPGHTAANLISRALPTTTSSTTSTAATRFVSVN